MATTFTPPSVGNAPVNPPANPDQFPAPVDWNAIARRQVPEALAGPMGDPLDALAAKYGGVDEPEAKTPDYDAIAAKYGGKDVEAHAAPVDYDALAAKHGGRDSSMQDELGRLSATPGPWKSGYVAAAPAATPGPQIQTPEQYAAARATPPAYGISPTARTGLPVSYTQEPASKELPALAGQEVARKISDAAPFLVGPFSSLASGPGHLVQGAGELALGPGAQLARDIASPQAAQNFTPEQLKQGASGVTHLVQGAFETAGPAMAGEMGVAAVGRTLAQNAVTGAAVVSGILTDMGVSAGLKHMGVAPEYADFAGSMAGLAVGFGLQPVANWWMSPKVPPEIRALAQTISDGNKATGDPIKDAGRIDHMTRLATQTEDPATAGIARATLLRQYGIRIPEPPVTAEPVPTAAEEQGIQPQAPPPPQYNSAEFTRAHSLWNTATNKAATAFMEQNPGTSFDDAKAAVQGTVGREPQIDDYKAPPPPPEPPQAPAKPEPVKPTPVAKVSPATPNPPTAAIPTQPESPETITLQVGQLGQFGQPVQPSQRKVVMFPGGQGMPDLTTLPAGVKLTHDEFGNVYVYRPDLITPGDIHRAAKNNTLPEVLGGPLGMGAPDKSGIQGTPVAVVSHAPQVATDPAGAQQSLQDATTHLMYQRMPDAATSLWKAAQLDPAITGTGQFAGLAGDLQRIGIDYTAPQYHGGVAPASPPVEAQTTVTDAEHLPQTVAATHAVTPPGGTVSVVPPEEALAGRPQTPQITNPYNDTNDQNTRPGGAQPGTGVPAPQGGAQPTPVPAGPRPTEPVSGLPAVGGAAPGAGGVEPVAGSAGVARGGETAAGQPAAGVRRVTGSADIPLTPAGEEQAARMAEEKITKPLNAIYESGSQRSHGTAVKFAGKALTPPTVLPSLNGWPRGATEGQPAETTKDLMGRLLMNPDEVPPGLSPFSGEPGKSWNGAMKPMFADITRVARGLKGGERVLFITSGGNLQAINAWGAAGYPASGDFDHTAIASQPYASATGKLFRLENGGLQEVPGDEEPGIYFSEHGETAWNSKGEKGGTAKVPQGSIDTATRLLNGLAAQINSAMARVHNAVVNTPTSAPAELDALQKLVNDNREMDKLQSEPDALSNFKSAVAAAERILATRGGMPERSITDQMIGAINLKDKSNDEIDTIAGILGISTPEQVQQEASPPTIENAPPDEPPHIKLANSVLRKLQNEEPIGNNAALQQLADQAYGGSRASGAYLLKEAHDAVEAAVNRYISDSVGSDLLTSDFAYSMDRLRELLATLPTQNVRTDDQLALQQFSTPPTLAFLAAKVAAILQRDTVGEPSGGTGGLAAWAKAAGAIVRANEIDPRRAELLGWAVRGSQPTQVDAEILNATWPKEIQPTVMIMNPPFSASGGRLAHNTNEVGFRHVINALARLQPGGRLVAILGEGARLEAPSARQFWADIAKRGLLRANVGISGQEYAKYGTTFGNRLIVIDKGKPEDWIPQLGRPAGLAPISGDFDTIEKAYDALYPIIGERLSVVRPGASGNDLATGSGQLPAGVGGQPVAPGVPGGAIRTPQPGTSGNGIPAGRPGQSSTPSASGQSGITSGNAPAATPGGTGGRSPVGHGGAGVAGAAGINPQDLIDSVVAALQAEGQTPVGAPIPVEAPPQPRPQPTRKPRAKKTAAPATPAAPPATPLDAAADKALQELRDMLGGGDVLSRPKQEQPAAPINPAIIQRLTLVGARAILRGATAYTDWRRAMVEQAGDILMAVSSRAKMPGEDLLQEIHRYASSAARQFGVEAEPTPDSGEDESVAEPPREDDRVALESQKQEDLQARVEDDGAFVQYVPAIQGLAHPGVVVESKVMASVNGPPITYRPNLPAKEIANSPKPLSAVQMEAIARAGQSHDTFNESGERHALLLGDGCVAAGTKIYDPIRDEHTQI